MTILMSDLQVWPWPLTYLNKCFKWASVQIILKSMNKCWCYVHDKPNLWPFYHLTFKCDLNLQPTWTNVSNEHLCQINLKSMQKYRSYRPDKLSLCPFLSFDFQVWPWPSTYLNKCFKWTTVPDYFEIHEQIYVMGLTRSIYDNFIIWPSSVTLTFNLPAKMFQMTLQLLKENNCAKLF